MMMMMMKWINNLNCRLAPEPCSRRPPHRQSPTGQLHHMEGRTQARASADFSRQARKHDSPNRMPMLQKRLGGRENGIDGSIPIP